VAAHKALLERVGLAVGRSVARLGDPIAPGLLVGLPTELNDLTKEAVAVAVARGWMPNRGDSVCLADAGRDVVRQG